MIGRLGLQRAYIGTRRWKSNFCSQTRHVGRPGDKRNAHPFQLDGGRRRRQNRSVQQVSIPPIPFTVLKTSCKCTLVIQSTLGFATMGKAQNSFYSRPLKITGTSVSSQKENKERWGIILNHLIVNKPPDVSSKPTEKRGLMATKFYIVRN